MAPSIIDLTKSRGRRLIPGDQFVLHTKGSEELNERTGWRNFFQEGDTLSCPTPDKPVMEILLGSGGTELMEAK